MAVEVIIDALPQRITLADGTEHTVTIKAGPKVGYKEPLFIQVVLAAGDVRFNNSGPAANSLALKQTGSELYVSVSERNKLRILGTTGDQIDLSQ